MPSDDTVSLSIPAFGGAGRVDILLDAADADWARQFAWRVGTRGYAVRNARVNGHATTLCLHRELLGLGVGDRREADHLNRDRLDNRRANLRIVAGSENSQNRSNKRGSRSQHRGVSWSTERQAWRVRVQLPGGKRVFLGDFESEKDAAEAARAARLRLLPFAVD